MKLAKSLNIGDVASVTSQKAGGNQVSEDTRIIYDLGANKGDNIPYYLKKADKIVAMEASHILANQIRARFTESISDGRLILHNCVLTCENDSPKVNFYIHKTLDVRSQFRLLTSEVNSLVQRASE
jgi:hypothetical protein